MISAACFRDRRHDPLHHMEPAGRMRSDRNAQAADRDASGALLSERRGRVTDMVFPDGNIFELHISLWWIGIFSPSLQIGLGLP